MFDRSRKLAMIGAICALVSESAQAAGEFEAAWREKFIEGYLQSLKEVAGDQPGHAQRADEAADCYMRYVMQEFTPDEVARLDVWATGGKSPGKDVEKRLVRRAMETVSNDVCQTNVPDDTSIVVPPSEDAVNKSTDDQ